jgi:hypothetical protein
MFSQAERYRRRGIEASQRASQATDPLIRETFLEIADNWIGLAEQAEWLASRFLSPEPSKPTQQQQLQQVQPKRED